ncbi:MAG: hypothetical protein GXY76_22670 [Chloroflexi bacterium]|nr:hypothetical protein [Chloroflexota bacterium]
MADLPQDSSLTYYLQQARAKAKENRFEEALADAATALNLALQQEEIDLIQAIRAEIKQARDRRVQELSGYLRSLLARPLDDLDRDALQKASTGGQEAFSELQSVDPLAAQPLAAGWNTLKSRIETRLDLLMTRDELNRLWAAPQLKVLEYRAALQKADEVAGRHPGEMEFRDLQAEAQRRLDEARKLEGDLTTQAGQAEFSRLLGALEGLKEAGETQLPWYEWGDQKREDGTSVRAVISTDRYAPAPEALGHVRQLAQAFEEGKAREYRQNAQVALPAEPEGAEEQIRKGLVFGNLLPDTRQSLQGYLDAEVLPAVAVRQAAKAKLDEALNTLRSTQDAAQAAGKAREAQRRDGHWLGFAAELHRELGPELGRDWGAKLRAAEEQRAAGEFKEALAAARRVQEQAAGLPGFDEVLAQAQALVECCQADTALFEQVTQQGKEIVALADQDLGTAERLLAEIETLVAGRPQRFMQLLFAPRRKVQECQTLEQAMAQWERRLDESHPARLGDSLYADADRVRGVLAGLQDINKEIDARGARRQLAHLRARVDARRRFIEGRADWEVGRYRSAQEHWQSVQQLNGDDAALAAEWLGRAQDASEVTEKLAQAQQLRAEGKLSQAAEVLDPWRTRASPLQAEVRKLHQAVIAERRAQLVQDIDGMIRALDENPVYSRLIRQVEALEEIDHDLASEYKASYYPLIHVRLGDLALKADQYDRALAHYETGLSYAQDAERSALLLGKRKAATARAWGAAEAHERDGQLGPACQALDKLLGDYADDIRTLYWLAGLALKKAETEQDPALKRAERERATRCCDAAERRLNEAERWNDPGRVGFASADEILEWQALFELMRIRINAQDRASRALERIAEQLRPEGSISEYRMAREAKDALQQALLQQASDMMAEEQPGARLQALPQAMQNNIARDRAETERYILALARDRIDEDYQRMEGDLSRELRSSFGKTADPPLESLVFQAAPPAAELISRWKLGLKINVLAEPAREGQQARAEVMRTASRLGGTVRQLVEDVRGPLTGLDGQVLESMAALETQIQWCGNAEEWATELRDMLNAFDFAKGAKEAPVGDSLSTRAYCNQLGKHKGALLNLRSNARKADNLIAAAVGAGRHQYNSWRQVDWSSIVKELLLANSKPLPKDVPEVGGAPDQQRAAFWSALEAADDATRRERWQTASEFLLEARYGDNLERVPWQDKINPIIRRARLDERWDEALDPLHDDMIQFSAHRVVEWLRQRRHDDEQKRNRLVIALAELYAALQADNWQAALAKIETMKKEDPQDQYGFWQRAVMREPRGQEPLSLDSLKGQVDTHLAQWQVLKEWCGDDADSALRRWNEGKDDEPSMRQQVVELTRSARFDEALKLCHDALEGAGVDQRTNQLGGGLSLVALLARLEEIPEAVRTPLTSRRLEIELARIDGVRHDANAAQNDIRSWLWGEEEGRGTGENGQELEPGSPVGEDEPGAEYGSQYGDVQSPPAAGPLFVPIPSLKRRYLHKRQALLGYLDQIASYNRSGCLRRLFSKGQQALLLAMCEETLLELRAIAPNSPELPEWERRIQGEAR